MKSKLTKSQLEVENSRLKSEICRLEWESDTAWAKQYDQTKEIEREFLIFKIMTHFINNGIKKDMAKILATDSFDMFEGFEW